MSHPAPPSKHAAAVTKAICEAAFNSSGRVREKPPEMLDVAPGTFRSSGKGEIIRYAVGHCSLGAVLVASSEKGICCILLGDQVTGLPAQLQKRFPNAEVSVANSDHVQLVTKVVGLVEMPGIGIDLPLDLRGTAFQQRVWQALRGIPAGSTASYTEIAAEIGSPKSVRAVASACAANPIAVAIPCHRVVRKDGALSGYRWGIRRKRALLDREAGL